VTEDEKLIFLVPVDGARGGLTFGR